jgi:hypothetical protein
MIYQENCFFFSRCDELIDFSTTIPWHHLSMIRKIRISLLLAHYSNHTDRSFNHKNLAQLVEILANMASLDDLFIDYDTTYAPFKRDILFSLCRINKVKNFTVVERQSSNLGTQKCYWLKCLLELAPYKYECYIWDRLSRVQARDSFTAQVTYP